MKHQRGAALLIVLVVITTLSALLYPLWQAQRMGIVRAQASQAQLQAWAVLLSTQDWVSSALKFDAEQSTIDSLQELWAQPMIPVPFEGGTVSGWLEDAQGRLNVNRLATDDTEQRQQVLAQFNRLCHVLNIECRFWESVADWIDADDIPSLHGAETSRYLSMKPPYRSANQPIVAVEELLSVIGVDLITLQRLNPYLVALPQEAQINVNTAKLPVIMALSPWMTEDIAIKIKDRQRQQPFDSLTQISALLKQNGVQDADANKLVNDQTLSVATHYFLLHAQADYLAKRWQLGATLRRDAGRVMVLSRHLEDGINE